MALNGAVPSRPEAARSAARVAARIAGLLVPVLALAVLASCVTTSRAAFGGAGLPLAVRMTGLLPANAFLYGSIRVDRERDLVTQAFTQSKFANAADVATKRTDLLVFAVGDSTGRGPSYSVVASGNYPLGAIALRLSSSAGWKRTSGSPTSWTNQRSGLQLAFPSRDLALLSDGELSPMLARYTQPSPPIHYPGVLSSMESADLVVYAPRVRAWLERSGGDPNRFPAESVLVAVSRVGESYRASAELVMRDAQAARLFSVIFRLLVSSGASEGLPISFAGATVAVQGSRIELGNLTVDRPGLAAILGEVLSGRVPRFSAQAGGAGA